MQNKTHWILCTRGLIVSLFAACLLLGCQSNKDSGTQTITPETKATPTAKATPNAATVLPPVPTEPTPARQTVRIKAGATASYTDSNGNAWLSDQGFADGETIARAGELPIANTKDPALYRTERYSMTAFAYKLPNGKYTVKLHFAETFEEINGPGQRVFSFKVQGQEFKDFDVFAKAGGVQRAYIETVNVEVTDGKLGITFTPNVQNPEINGIEIIPVS
jgi:endoglucanase